MSCSCGGYQPLTASQRTFAAVGGPWNDVIGPVTNKPLQQFHVDVKMQQGMMPATGHGTSAPTRICCRQQLFLPYTMPFGTACLPEVMAWAIPGCIVHHDTTTQNKRSQCAVKKCRYTQSSFRLKTPGAWQAQPAVVLMKLLSLLMLLTGWRLLD